VYYILGDLNINIQKENLLKVSTEFLNIITSNEAFSIITKPITSFRSFKYKFKKQLLDNY